ncbi:hypothetical protein [Nocardia sp. MDA0666]|uniref:hypothetical protein n=1 Tax=Nocardia sp. MDA0666 TaxID=2135448 RepID=UPI0011B20E9C|nr:hypothetical protein [Nocardia sp. MDA0666]
MNTAAPGYIGTVWCDHVEEVGEENDTDLVRNMSKKIAGIIFSTPQEAGVEPPTPEELEKYKEKFKEARKRLRAASPDPDIIAGDKSYDAVSGTEFDVRRGKSGNL